MRITAGAVPFLRADLVSPGQPSWVVQRALGQMQIGRTSDPRGMTRQSPTEPDCTGVRASDNDAADAAGAANKPKERVTARAASAEEILRVMRKAFPCNTVRDAH